MKGIDGEAVLEDTLNLLSDGSDVAANAPRGRGITTYLSRGIERESAVGSLGEYWGLTVGLIQMLSIWWSPDGYQQIPVMTPWCIRDRKCRYDHGPEAWSAPREDGYLRDDNSIIKKLPMSLLIYAPIQPDYDNKKLWRGFTACHVWRDLDEGKIAGADPWLYSFMPNLVWLPRPLSALTDFNREVMNLLQCTSTALYRDREMGTLHEYAEYAWSELTTVGMESGRVLDLENLARFRVDVSFVERRLKYLDDVVVGVDEIICDGGLSEKLISSRYTTGLPNIPPLDLVRFQTSLATYRDSVREKIGPI